MYARPLAFLLLAGLSACGGSAAGPDMTTPGPDLSQRPTVRIHVGDQPFEVWVASTNADQQRGLRGVTAEQLLPLPDGTPRGMLFPFASERIVSIVMDGVEVPLDLAFLAADGTVFETHALQPLDPTPVRSALPARWALEVRAGDFSAHGVGVGDTLAPIVSD